MSDLTPLSDRGKGSIKRDIMSKNTRCEIAEGVAFSPDLAIPEDQQITVNDLIHHYLDWVFGEANRP